MPGFSLPSASLLAQSILSGIFVGALYGLLGLGLSLSWGLLRLINLAHFGLAFLAAYLCYQLSLAHVDPLLSLLLIVPLLFAIGVGLHWVMARFAVTPFNSLLLTFGLTGILEALIQAIWTADFRKLESSYGNVKWKIGGLYFPLPEVITLLLAVGISFADLGGAALHRSRQGDARRRRGPGGRGRVRRRPEAQRACCSPAPARRSPASPASASRSASPSRRRRSTPGSASCSRR